MKIVTVTKEYFETDNGEKHYHPVPLEEVPTLEEFQKMYDRAEKFFKKEEQLWINLFQLSKHVNYLGLMRGHYEDTLKKYYLYTEHQKDTDDF